MKINHSKQAGLAKNHNANDTSFGAFSMACERVELAKLNAHKFLYAQAIHHLSASIVLRASHTAPTEGRRGRAPVVPLEGKRSTAMYEVSGMKARKGRAAKRLDGQHASVGRR